MNVRAADTTEPYGIGVSDFELYLGFDGAGLAKYEKTVWAETLVGFGFTERFSGYVTAFAEGNERFSAGAGGAGFGVLGAPVDTDHFDLDLLFGAGFGGDEIFAAPGLEFNLDARSDLALCGLYLRAEEVLTGRDESIADDPATSDFDESLERYTFAPTTALTAGAYFTIAEVHQILLEYDIAFHHNAADAPEGSGEVVERGGVALGYNVQVADIIELITEVSVDVPNDGEDLAAGFMIGFVATMPSGAE